MSLDDPDAIDVSLILEALADMLQLLPEPAAPAERAERAEREQFDRTLRYLARESFVSLEQSFDQAKGQAGHQYRNALLRAAFGGEGAAKLLSR